GSLPDCSQASVRRSSTRGLAPPDTRRSVSASGASPIRRRSGDKGDTVDLLQRGLAGLHGVEGGVAQEARAARLRGLLELAHRRTPGDELADLVVEDHELGDGLASLEPRAAALAAAAAYAEAVRAHLLRGEAGFLEERFLGSGVLGAVGTDQAHQALREDRV